MIIGNQFVSREAVNSNSRNAKTDRSYSGVERKINWSRTENHWVVKAEIVIVGSW
jgi:hypothetical protein